MLYRYGQARSQDLEKGGGGYFERVRSVQTTLTRIFIDLESVSDGLSEIWDEKSRKNPKFKGFFRPKLGDLQKKEKKKKGLRRNSEWFFSQNSKVFSAQNQVISKKKKKSLRQNSGRFFFQNFASSNVSGGLFSYGGGLFSIFYRKSASKAQKPCDIAYFTNQWGGSSPPPLATLLGTDNLLPVISFHL